MAAEQSPAEAPAPADAAPPPGYEAIEHTTGKGKVLRGVVVKGIKGEDALKLDGGTFKKDGGYFVREKHWGRLPPVVAGNDRGESAPADAPASASTDAQPAAAVDKAKKDQKAEFDRIRAEIAAKKAPAPVDTSPGRAQKPAESEQVAPSLGKALQTAMGKSGWAAEDKGEGNTFWSKRQGQERYTARWDREQGRVEVTALEAGGVETQIAFFEATDAQDAARRADKAVADDLAEIAARNGSASSPAPEKTTPATEVSSSPAEPEVTSSQQPLSDAEQKELDRMLGLNASVGFKDMGGHWMAEATGNSLRMPVRARGSSKDAARRNLLQAVRQAREEQQATAAPSAAAAPTPRPVQTTASRVADARAIGAQAYAEDADRVPPQAFTTAEKRAWLDGYDNAPPRASAAPAPAPAAADPTLDDELNDALGKLGDVLGDVFGAKKNITGPQYGAADLLPALSKVVELLVRKGFKSFAQAAGKAAALMRANEKTAAHVDAITPRQWKAAYNAIAEGTEGTDTEEALSAMTAEQVKAIVSPAIPPAAESAPAPEAQNQAKEPANGNAPRQLDRPGQRALEGAPADPVQAPDAGGRTGQGAEGSGSADGDRVPGAEGAGAGRPGGVGDGAGALPVPGRGAGRKPRGEPKPRVRRDARPDADPGLFGDGAGPDPQGLTAPNVAPPAPPAFTPTDFEIADDLALGEGGQKAKYRGNVEAIRLLRDLEATGRTATPAEQRVLARYVGWGGIAQAFDAGNKDWTREYAELKELLTPEEWATANESTQYAHYTSREIIGGIYEALARMGFTGGKILEPGSGVGNFVGLMPAGLRTSSRFTGVEREAIAVGIAKQLYPRQNIQRADFTEFIGNDGFFDLAIGNPPFARNPLTDKSGRKHLTGLSVHNYFFAKAVDMLREGGILAQVVSNSFLDAKRDTARRYIADRTEFLGAIRLPNNAFAKNANTEVTTDIVFLRKLPESEWGSRSGKENRDRWLDTQNITDPNGGDDIPVNRYFAENPEMMLGQMGRYGTMYGPGQPALVAKPGQDTAALLRAAIARLPEGVYTPPAVANTAAMGDAAIVALRNPKVQEGGHYVEGDKLYRRLQDVAGEARAVELTPDTQWTEKTKLGEEGFARIKALAGLRQTLRDLLAAELADAKDIEALRTRLNTEYDAYAKRHGLINDRPSARVFDDDPDYPLLASLEHGFTPGIGAAAARKMGVKPMLATAKKGPIFKARVIEKRTAPTRASSPADALNISMAERGRIDAAYIGELLGISGEEALRDMSQGAKPLLFMDPASNEYVLRDAYLSGNVRAKLAQARQAGMMANARALEEVQPPDVSAGEISVRVGSPWVPTPVYEAFARHLFGDGTSAKFIYVKANSSFMDAISGESDVASSATWGTPSYPGPQILTSLMNNREIKVMFKDADGSLKVDREATDAANQKATEIKQAFSDWVFSDPERADVLTKAYNEANNNYVTRAFDGGYMQFPGKVPDSIIKFRRHQRNAIARIVQDRTALLDHVVGAGKTFTVISAAMELKRTGLANKPLIMVPNHLVKQWAADFYRLYPGANILTATKKDFEKTNRRRFLAKIATGNWDAVIMAHSSFGFIKPAPEFEAQFNEQQVKNVMDTIDAVNAGDADEGTKKRTVKQLAALKERLENRIDALRQKPIDALLDFKEIGVDQLFVDEAHLFKNLMFTTKMQNVRGLGDSAGSQRAYDLFIKTNQLYAQNGRGQGVVFATGTPVSNSLAEMYHMMRYLMPQALQEGGFESFDAWANTFASVEQVWMQKISANGFKADNRMSTFVNTHELLKMFDQVADTVTMDDIKKAYAEENDGREFPLPKLKTGRRQPVSLDKSQAQEDYMAAVAARAQAIEGKRTNEKGMDNALKIMGDARKAAMDIRLVDVTITEREKGGRIDRAADEIAARYRQYGDVKGTQLVFSDLGTPIKHAREEMKEWEALQARIQKGVDPETVTAANFGNEAAMKVVEDAEDAQREMDEKGADWLDAVKAALRGFSVYDDLRAALVERGIPDSEIAFIHDYNTDDQKLSLFRKMNAGDMRVLIGSTPKLGAGTNVQDRLVALHHLDVPWKPSDVEQREGRIIRQGNKLMDTVPGFEVEILAYVTKDTLDMRMWQVQETKLKMINQLRTRQISREIDNAFEDMEMSAGEMQAAATGNMDLLKEIQLRTDVKKLEQAKRSFDATRNDLVSRRRRADEAVATLPAKIARAEKMAEASKAYTDAQKAQAERFSVTVNGKAYTDAREAGAVLQAFVDAKQFTKKGTDIVLTPEQYQAMDEDERSASNGWQERPVPLKVEMDGKTYTARAALGEAFADLRGDVNDAPLWQVDGQTYIRRTKAAAAIAQRVADSMAEMTEAEVGRIGPFTVTVEGQPPSAYATGTTGLEVVIRAPGGVEASTTLNFKDIASEDDARKAATGVINAAMSLASGGQQQVLWLRSDLERQQRVLADLATAKVAADFPQQDKLEAARAAHKEVLARLAAKPEQPAAPEADEAAGDTALSRGAGRGVAMADAEAARDALLRAMPKAPRITLLERVDQAPASLLSKISSAGASADVEGAFHEGEVFIFPGNIDSLERLQFVMAHHELRHYGLRSLMPNQNRRGPLLLAIYNTNPEIRRQADDKMAAGLAGSKVLAVEEALADMPVEQMQALKGGPRLLAALRDVLRKLAEVFRSLGWVRVADALEPATWTDADVVALVRRAEAVSRTGGPLFRVGDTAFSRSPSVATKALTAALSKPGAALRDVRLPAGYVVGDWFGNSLGRLHWWHKTVGTPYNLAERERSFRPVFESIQNFMDDISHYATEAANLAPSILPKLESITDILKAPLPPADVKALAAPVFEGTLGWGRDLDGKPVRMVDLEAKAAQLSAEDKAQEMLRRRLLNPRVLKMWQGLPLEQFEAAVETRYQNEVLKPGVVWSDGELRTMFGLSPRQIALYREFRSATDKSLDDLTITTMLRVGGEEVADLREQVLAEPDLMTAAELIRDRLFDLAEQQPENADAMNARGNGIIDIADRVEDLKDRGYAPLSRFGQYTLDVVTPDGVRQFFGMYESRSERAKAVRLMRENFPDADIKQGTTSEEEFKLFAGVTPETLELFGDKLGLSDEVAKSSLFQKWLQVAKANRSGMKRLIHRKGVPGFSEDVGRVLASFIYSNARQASSNLHAGAAERAIEEIPQSKGQLKDYAVRLNEYVKNPQEEAQALRSVLFAQFLGGSIASAIVNATQPFMVTLPYLTQFGGVGKAGARMAAALKDVGRREFPKDKGLTEALNRAAEDGIVAPQEVFFLQAQASGKAQLQSGDGTLLGNAGARVNNGISRLTLAWGKPFSFAELFNRRLTFIAAYRTAQEEGMSRPYEFAIKAVRETQFLYNKGNRPRWARGAVGALLFTFKTYSVSMVEHLARNAKTPQGRRALLAALVMIAMMAGLDGLPFMEDVEDVIDGVMQRVFDKNFSLRFERNQWIARQLIALVGEDLGQPVADFLAKGVTGLPGAPFDVSGRLGLHNIIPGTGVFLKKDSYARDVADVAGAAGSFVARMFDAIGKAAEGRMKEALVLASPIAVQNAVKGGMMAQTGMYPDTRENMVVKTTLADAGFKAAGFQPKVVQKAQQVAGESARAVALVRQVETEIVTAMAKALARSDPAGLREALERLDSWNRKNPGSPIRITPSQVRERLKSMTTEKSVRLLKSAPREMRPGLAERFQQLEPQE